MGGRGRGGRGRGRGATLEQLGVQKGEMLPEQVAGPPETYPPLEFRPVQPAQEKNLAESYLLVVKKEFREHMQNSQYLVQPGVKKPDIERYSDRYQLLASHRGRLTLNWSRFPRELHPSSVSALKKKKRKLLAKKMNSVNAKRARTRDVNVSETLEALEKKEEQGGEDNEEEGDEGMEEKADDEGLEELEEVDEELDEGTDYVNNYFDNGESYIDEEDDALEEGGVF